MLNKKDNDTQLDSHLEAVEKHMKRLGKIREKMANTTDAYVRKSLTNQLARESETAGTAVKKYIESGGDPENVAAFFNDSNKPA